MYAIKDRTPAGTFDFAIFETKRLALRVFRELRLVIDFLEQEYIIPPLGFKMRNWESA